MHYIEKYNMSLQYNYIIKYDLGIIKNFHVIFWFYITL